MHARLLAAASFAILLGSCSSIYDTTDFLKTRGQASAAVAPAEAEAAAATVAAADTSDAAAEPEAAATARAGPDTAAEPPPADPAVAQAGAEPAAPETAEASAAPPAQPRGLLAMFGLPTTSPAAKVTEKVIADDEAPAGAPAGVPAVEGAADTKIIPQAEAVRTGVLPGNPDEDGFTEADLAGEVEADPNKIAVPEPPYDDGLEHDFVNVYTSKPDAVEPSVPGLPGVTWERDIVLVSRGPNGDPSDLFTGGGVHPFARTVPGIPQKVVQAANGLLLQHAAINVGCVKPALLNLVRRAENHFGKKVVITSGYRSPSHNARVNGAKHSQHMFCNALDLYMPGVARDDLARFFFGQPDRGGIGLYCSMKSIHIDIGKRREWRWPCRRRG